MFNWRPVYDIEQETEQLKIRSLESEKRTKLLEIEDKRLAELESQARCLVAQCRFLLADTSLNRLQLSEALAVLLEELRLPKA